MEKYFLAVDIGASGGRHILAHMEDERLCLEEVYRFDNGMNKVFGKLLWDTERLFKEIKNGMKQCLKLGKVPFSMSIDTWAVDYVLLDKHARILGDTYGYRDHRTDGMDTELKKIMSEEELYKKTGIQKNLINTIYQLMALKRSQPGLLDEAKTFLMLPDYFGFLLTGNMSSEYTNATTTQLVSPLDQNWNKELLSELGFPEDIFLHLSMPGTSLGNLSKDVREEIGYDTEVILCSSHDTASAVMAAPDTKGQGIFLSSGTWSLIGIESEKPIISDKSRIANFTNEGGYGGKYCFLKNIMGLWMIQSVRHETNDKYSFGKLCDMAEECIDFPSRVDVNSDDFLSPDNMTKAIKSYCRKSGQKVPESIGEISTVIYQSLADSYGRAVSEIEDCTGRTFNAVNVIGGGSNAAFLNQITADSTGKTVYAGPGEATAIGNLLAQMINKGVFKDLTKARECVKSSFDLKKFEPGKYLR